MKHLMEVSHAVNCPCKKPDGAHADDPYFSPHWEEWREIPKENKQAP